MSKQLLITIDGPSASGKSSISRRLAKELGINWVSTGNFYRGVAFMASRLKVDLGDEDAIVEVIKNEDWSIDLTEENTLFRFLGEDLTSQLSLEEVGAIASKISSFPKVRKALLQSQRDCLKRSPKGLVAEGRDCGTVVFPDASVKIYLTADSSDRAKRRALEEGKSVKETRQAQKERDLKDQTRNIAPLQVPPGSEVVDTTGLSLDEAAAQVISLVESILATK
ncbi:MAG: cytidylate kinase [Proteobacteria bacterium SG_bin7]|nr:MAG: cytidylate kinase [Proteobacteria bacterium SG_bin7]